MTKEEQNRARQNRAAIFTEGMQRLRHRRKSRFGLWTLLVVALLLTLMIIPKGDFSFDHYVPGDIALRDVKSPRDLLIEDKDLTLSRRVEAAAGVALVYNYDRLAGNAALQRIRDGLLLLPEPAPGLEPVAPEGLQKRLEAELGVPVTRDNLQALQALPLTTELVDEAISLLRPLFRQPLVADLPAFKNDLQRGVALISSEGAELASELLADAADLSQALAQADGRLGGIAEFNPQQKQTLVQLIQQQLRPNLVANPQLTEQRRNAAWEQVAPVLFQIKKGEMVVREGERVSSEQIRKLQAIRDQRRDHRTTAVASGLLISILVLLSVGFVYAQRNVRKFNPDSRDILFLATVFVLQTALVKLSLLVSTGLGNAFGYIDSFAYHYAIPFALGAMLVRMVLNAEIALLFSLCFALLMGVVFGDSFQFIFYVLSGSLIGAHAVRHCQARSTIYRAGLWVGLGNVAVLLGVHLLSGATFELLLLWKLLFAFTGGIICAMLVNGTVPLIESVFKYTTEIKLLELANMNSPVLRQLMIEAPGTYHHSILVGNLAEAAAESINANPLMARVASYYHDIGKIKKPLYFIENSGGQRSKHDKLAPSMSALILMAHIKDGVELAKEHKLGAELIDVIQQHHGTSLIKFFYERAKTQADPGVQQVDERDYRYPGPKPQTREAALIMLADSIEAASRTLADPTPARIQGMVQKLINNIFTDGQLDECDLTLKDLNQIAKSFNRVLSGSFHQRVAYPEPVHIVKEKSEPAAKAVAEKTRDKSAHQDRKPADENKNTEETAAPDSAEDLKRLGVS